MLELVFGFGQGLIPCLHDEVMDVARCFGEASQGGGDQVVDVSGFFIAHGKLGLQSVKGRHIRQGCIALGGVMDMVAEVLQAVGEGEEGGFKEGVVV